MAHFVNSEDIPTKGEHLDKGKLAFPMMVTGGIAAIGLIGSIIFFLVGGGSAHGSYSFSWLLAVFFVLTITFGGCFFTLLHNLSNSGWGTSVRRLMENLGFVFPFMFLFSIPFFFPSVQQYLWEWMTAYEKATAAHPGMGASEALMHSADAHDHLLAKKTFYLNPTFWNVRFVLYFLGLGGVIYLLRKISIAQDTEKNPGVENLFKARSYSSWGMIIFGVSMTFLALDWVMALDFSWFSTMFGVYVFAGSALSSMAVLILTTVILQKMGYLKKVVTYEHTHIMGKLMFAFTVFWAYVSFSQFFLYWYANIPEETRYFILRNTGNWNVLSIGLVFLHFGLPFLLLLRSDVKKKPGFLIFISCYILIVHLADVYHMIIPERGPSVGLVVHHHAELWLNKSFFGDIIALVTVISGFLFFYLRNLGSAALYPNRDPRILESANLTN
ncbi:hypothetical protein N9268_01150 [Akkermansiaceae bacterium]|nr:hypothetical protein [Akkermansiaceae bacterium]MDB4455907.1 hypothetical protein [bacterium]MDA8876175.1 hypothetical protein [Akkermansiaceae bacterium]MDB4421559.1 hypothetical protein [Akkermansiaceae bacterium]MDB4545824.1 hypothetical protein [Akkermansiaceae bacterium]